MPFSDLNPFFPTHAFQVVGKFSLRLVPDQNPRYVAEKVKCYLQEVHASRCSGNNLRIKAFRDGQPFLADHSSPNYQAAYDALLYVWEKPPDFTREGATISMAAVLEVGSFCVPSNVVLNLIQLLTNPF